MGDLFTEIINFVVTVCIPLLGWGLWAVIQQNNRMTKLEEQIVHLLTEAKYWEQQAKDKQEIIEMLRDK